MAIDDKLQKTIDEYQKHVLTTPSDYVVETAISLIPVAGSAILAIMGGAGRQRILQRAAEVFTEMKEELSRLGEDAINRDFFETEEFQTLLALAMEQLQTTHDREKLKMLARALAHSGI